MGQTQVDEDAQLDDRNQDDGEAEALFHQGDNQEDGNQGYGGDHGEVMVGGFNHVLHAGGFANEHSAGVVLFQDFVQGGQLGVYFVAGGGVLGVNQHQLPVFAFQLFPGGSGNHLVGNPGANHALQP